MFSAAAVQRIFCAATVQLVFVLPHCGMVFGAATVQCFLCCCLFLCCHCAVCFLSCRRAACYLCCHSAASVLCCCSAVFLSFFLSLAATVPQQSGPNGVMGPLGAQYPRCRWGCGWDAPQVHWGTGTQSWGATGTHPRSTVGRVPRVGV